MIGITGSIQRTFETTLKGKNIMTPEIIEYGIRGEHIYELSSGRGFGDRVIYGITVIELATKKHDKYLSGMYDSMDKVDLALSLLKDGDKLVW